MPSSLRTFHRHWPLGLTLLCFLIAAGISIFPPGVWSSSFTQNELPLHIILEFIGILVSFAVFTVGWATYQNARSTDILVLSLIAFIVGWMDLGHTLSFTGMPDFFGPSGNNKSIDFWLVSRLSGSIGFLYVSLSRPRVLRTGTLRFWLMSACVAWTLLWFYLILFRLDELPIMFRAGLGLTETKRVLEWTSVLFSFAAGLAFFSRGSKNEVVSMQWMGCACMIFAFGGFFFTRYRDFNDLYVFVGHVYKALGSIVIYRAVFIECVSKPYDDVRRLAREALEANSSKSRFLANVSHELRTPLGIISGYAELLTQSTSLNAESHEWSATISRNSRQLGQLIDDLLDLSKAENEKMSVEWTDFDPNSLISEVVSGLQLAAEKNNVAVKYQSELSGLATIRSDEVRFRQILLNVVGNAVKFTSFGTVIVTARRRTDDLNREVIEVSVKDTGIGLSHQDTEKLFQPFAQADDPNRRRFSGTGLGLALSKKLSVLLGGDLVLRSSRLNSGSEFVFWILNQPNDVAVREQKLKPNTVIAPDFSGRKILAAEDSADNRNLLQLYLKPTNVELTFAVNGAQAVELASVANFDLILMDIQMPVLDGFEATARLRTLGIETPILALTAHAHQPEQDRAMIGGFSGYLIKPLSKADLWDQLSRRLPATPR